MNATDDWFETEHLAPFTYRITEGQGYLPCNTYLVGDGEHWVTIDAGLGIGDLRSHVEALAGSVPRLILTHRHWDHIGAANQFPDVAISEREQEDGVVTTTTKTPTGVDLAARFVERWAEMGKDFPNGFDPEQYSIKPVEGVTPLSPEEIIDVGSKHLEIVPIPGHSPGQLALLDRETSICFAADIFAPDGSLLAPFPDANLNACHTSVQRLIDLRDAGAFDTLATGHGSPIADNGLDLLDQLHHALDTILRGEADFTVGDDWWGDVRRYSVGDIEVVARP